MTTPGSRVELLRVGADLVDDAIAEDLADAPALRAALVPGSVYENDGATLSATKRLHVILTPDGSDIHDLVIEDA